MADDQRHGRIFGVLFILTFLTSILAYLIFESILDDPAAFISERREGRTGIYLAILLGVLPCPLECRDGRRPLSDREAAKRRPGVWASSRLESSSPSSLQSGIIFVLGVVSYAPGRLRHAADLAVSLARAQGLDVPVRPGLIVPLGNGLILGYLMYSSGLVPRRMAWLGTDRRPDFSSSRALGDHLRVVGDRQHRSLTSS